jgi:hypothetical protein
MTTSLVPRLQVALRHAAARATLAPSIHNTQPWRFVVRQRGVDLFADPSRRLLVLDPTGRQLALSCGAALLGARVSLAAAKIDVSTIVLPDPADVDLLATMTIIGASADLDSGAVRLDAAADSRRSNRRQFVSDDVPDSVIETLRNAAAVEGAWLQPVTTLDDRIAVATLTQHADDLQNASAAYRSELLAWTSGDPDRRDGIPSSAIPHNSGGAHDDIPIRQFDTRGEGALPQETRSRLNQTMLVLGTEGDGRRDWLLAGQALGRVLLELTAAGFVASIFSQVAEVPGTREQLRRDLRLSGHPHLLLRVGRADPTPPTPRRALEDVIGTG